MLAVADDGARVVIRGYCSIVQWGEAAWLDFHAWQLVEGGKLSLRLPTDGSTASAAIDGSPGG